MANDILVIGEALIDIIRRSGQPPAFLPGGSCMNVAVGLGRLGHDPALASWFGQDAHGRAIAAHCAESRVRILPGCDQAARTTTAEAILDEAGHAQYSFDIDWRMPVIAQGDRPGLIHTGSLGALIEPGGTDVFAYLEANRDLFITFDPNCRPIMGEPGQVRAKVERYLGVCDLVKVSDEDLAWLYPGVNTDQDLLEAAQSWVSAGSSVVVVTRGANGALAVTVSGERIQIEADTSRGMVDTVGAGDAFMAGLIHSSLTHGYTFPDAKTQLGRNPADLESILTEAATIAAITVSRPGADPPWFDELGTPSVHTPA